MSPELIVLLAGIVILCGIETWYIASNQKTISERVRDLFRLYPPFGFLVGLVSGLLLGHFFWCP